MKPQFALRTIFLSLGIFLLGFSALYAQTLSADQEERFNKLALEVRCVVCQSEPVATSQAKIAIDMRVVIRQRIAAGDSDKQVRQYFSEHYGENVLLRPQMNSSTILLWAAPFLLLAFGGFFLLYLFKNQKAAIVEDKTDEIETALKSIED